MKKNLSQIRFISSQKGLSKNSEFQMKEFTINKFLKLRLEDDKTIIYVNNKRFDQCKFLLLHIPVEEVTSLEDIESIDDFIIKLKRSPEKEGSRQFSLPPDIEFWGHCSNLQVWYENNYNTKLLYRNIAFPLLRELTDVGDKLAEEVFREEIVIRFSEGNQTIREYLREEGYLGYLDKEQFYCLLYEIKINSLNDLFKIVGTYFIVNKRSVREFTEFINTLDNRRLKDLLKESKYANELDFCQALIDYLGKYRKKNSESKIIRDIFKNVSTNFFDFLMKLITNNKGYINLPVLEALIYINETKMRKFLENTEFKLNLGTRNVLWDFQYILNVLLRCFNPEELTKFLEENYKDILYKTVLPEIHRFKFLKMSSKKRLDMKHFLTVFLLEEAGADYYIDNLKKLGVFLADTFLSELIDRNGELEEEIIKTLYWIGGEAEEKLYERLNGLSDRYDIEKYKKLSYY